MSEKTLADARLEGSACLRSGNRLTIIFERTALHCLTCCDLEEPLLAYLRTYASGRPMQVLSLPYFEWAEIESSPNDQEEYLRKLLELPAAKEETAAASLEEPREEQVA